MISFFAFEFIKLDNSKIVALSELENKSCQ